jgi:putative Holliday junction resolvase
MSILGIDYGLARIGIAIAEGSLSEPLLQVKNPGNFRKLIAALCGLVEEHQVTALVVGMPEGKLAGEVKKLTRRLREQLRVEIHTIDETLTTVEAQRKLIEIGRHGQKAKGVIDATAATLILQSWLDQNPQTL